MNTLGCEDVRLAETGSPSTTKPSSQTFEILGYYNMYNQMYKYHWRNDNNFSGGDAYRAIQEGAGKPSLQACHRLCQTPFGSRGEHVLKNISNDIGYYCKIEVIR